jgi:hypothetical protein
MSRATRLALALGTLLAAPAVRAGDQGDRPEGCAWSALPDLPVRDGFVQFMPDALLGPLKAALPEVEDPVLAEILASPDTMWFDEQSMVFLYQDSVESVVGGRANCVGRMTGERNQGSPIAKLMNLFGPDYRFKFPFRKAAGTEAAGEVRTLNFWSPPRAAGKALPTKWWKTSSRGRWNWVFPVGTVMGEVLFVDAPDGAQHVFEIRIRKRYRDGWDVDAFRPFKSAAELATAVKTRRPDWASTPALKRYVDHLASPATLSAAKMESVAFKKIFPTIEGWLDVLPDAGDAALITDLLTTTPFVSVEGTIWKEDGAKETYAPASAAPYGVVPKGYDLGLIPVNEVSCNRCHDQVGHPLGDFEFDVILYGEIWGEDRIFTWHLFEPHRYVFDTWDDSDSSSRKLSDRLSRAGLLKNERPAASDPLYKQLPVPYARHSTRPGHGTPR